MEQNKIQLKNASFFISPTKYVYVKGTTECMSPRRNWDSPNPSLAGEYAPRSPQNREGGHTRLRVRGWGSPNSDDWRKSLALCLLCDLPRFSPTWKLLCTNSKNYLNRQQCTQTPLVNFLKKKQMGIKTPH